MTDPLTGRALDVTAERLHELLDYDLLTGTFTWRVAHRGTAKAGAVAGSPGAGYVCIRIDGRRYLAHRLAWLYVHGGWPDTQVDHINGDPTDNRLANLRMATPAQNQQNQRRARADNKCGLLGVSLCRGRWQAEIRLNGKGIYLGRFDTPKQAHDAYLAAKARLHPFQTLTAKATE